MNVNPRIPQPARNSKAMITGSFVRNAWYVAMWGEDSGARTGGRPDHSQRGRRNLPQG